MTTSTLSATSTSAGVQITRTFDASRERVFSAWVEPEQFASWFGTAAADVPLDQVEMDVRPGGSWRLSMHTRHGLINWHGEYREVDRPHRLVFTLADRVLETGAQAELVVVDLAEAGGRAELRFAQTGGNLTEEMYLQVKDGWLSFFDSLDELLARD